MIPQFTLERQNRILDREIKQAIENVITRGIFILGPKVAEFEEAFARYEGVKYAVGVASGTDALSLALLALGVGRGDEVIVPANAYPTAFAATAIGAVPRLVDIDEKTYAIDPEKIPDAINKKTKAIIPVHLYGQPADMKRILEIGKKYKIPVVEDCAQAHGAEIKKQITDNNEQEKTGDASGGPPIRAQSNRELEHLEGVTSGRTRFEWRKVGSIGDVGCFSFYPTKNLGCFGDGGMVVTNNKEIYQKVKLLRMYGEKERYNSILLGRNSRLDELQAAILLVKLNHLDKWNDRRREIASLYKKQITDNKKQNSNLQPTTYNLQLPIEISYAKHVYHLFVIRTQKRDKLKKYLEKLGIQTAIHYPKPIHLEPSFRYLGHGIGDFPKSERACKEILSLPMFPELKNEEVKEVIEAISHFSYFS